MRTKAQKWFLPQRFVNVFLAWNFSLSSRTFGKFRWVSSVTLSIRCGSIALIASRKWWSWPRYPVRWTRGVCLMKIKEVVLCTARLLAPQWILQQPGFAADLMVSKRVTLLPNIEEYFYVDSVERFKNSQSLSTLIILLLLLYPSIVRALAQKRSGA